MWRSVFLNVIDNDHAGAPSLDVVFRQHTGMIPLLGRLILQRAENSGYAPCASV
jgi:hypothetical protein